VRKGQDQEEEEMGPRVAEIWVSTGEAGNRLRWESIKGVQIVREAEGISFSFTICSLYIFGTTLLAVFPPSPSFHRTPFSKIKTSLFIQ
jgi:hypothetical protein